MSPQVIELVEAIVALHEKAGGTAPDAMRQLLRATCDLAECDGMQRVIGLIGSHAETHALLRRVSA